MVVQYVGERRSSSVDRAVKDDSRIKTVVDLKGKTVGISIIGGGTHGLFALMLKRAGVDPDKDIKLVECRRSRGCAAPGPRRRGDMNQPFAARAEAKGGVRKPLALSEVSRDIVHIVQPGRQDFVDKIRAGQAVRQGHHGAGGPEDGAGRSGRDHEGGERDHEGAGRGARDLSAEGQRLRARAGRRAELLRRHPGDVRRLHRRKMLEKKLNANALKEEGIVAPLE